MTKYQKLGENKPNIPEGLQGQAGWGSAQPAPVESVPTHGRGLEPDDL